MRKTSPREQKCKCCLRVCENASRDSGSSLRDRVPIRSYTYMYGTCMQAALLTTRAQAVGTASLTEKLSSMIAYYEVC